MTPQYIARVPRARGFSYCRQSNHLIGFCSGRYALRCQRKSPRSVLEVPRYKLSQAGQSCGAAYDTSVPGALAGIDGMVCVQIQPARRKMTGSAAHGQINDLIHVPRDGLTREGVPNPARVHMCFAFAFDLDSHTLTLLCGPHSLAMLSSRSPSSYT